MLDSDLEDLTECFSCGKPFDEKRDGCAYVLDPTAPGGRAKKCLACHPIPENATMLIGGRT